MKTFSFKNYKIIPFVKVEDLNKALEKDSVMNIPEEVFVASDEVKACYFVVADKDSLDFVLYASFVFDKNNKKMVQVRFTSTTTDEKMLEKIITKTTDYVYNKVGGIYFRINADGAEEAILKAAVMAGYKKDASQTFYVLDKNIEIGILSIFSNI